MKLQTQNFKKIKKPLWLSAAALFAAGIMSTGLAHAQVTPAPTEPAQKPLVTAGGTSAAPNIMIIYDDSGSMNNVAIPDDAAPMHYASLHPEDIGLSNALPYNEIRVIPTGADEIAAALVRSHQINPLYYNPETTYHPWKGANGEPIVERKNINPRSVPTYANTYRGVVPARNSYINLTEDKVYDFNAGTDGKFRGMRRGYCTATEFSPILSCNGWVAAGKHRITPAVYFIYNGSDGINANFSKWSRTNPNILKIGNYTRVVINDIKDDGPKEGRGILQKDSRTDCGSLPSPGGGYVRCSKDEEMQNFAVWYIFYRDRIRAATGALSQVFSQEFDVNFRLAWTALNKTSIQGIRQFDLDTLHATSFFNWIFNFEIAGAVGSTPTLNSLGRAGAYFMGEEPWFDDPAKPDRSKPMLACRRNYTILMTDGGWNDQYTGAALITPDGKGLEIANPDSSKTYTYSGVKADGTKNYPYYDGNGSNISLARVAHHYWATDLKPTMPNILPGTGVDGDAFWQNMVTHTIGFGVSGLLDFPGDWEALKTGRKPWSNPAGTGGSEPGKIDDLWHTAVTGHGTYASAGNLTDLIESISSILTTIAAGEVRSPHATLLNNSIDAVGNVYYVPQYYAGAWSGDLTAYPIKAAATGSGKVVETDYASAKWKASAGVPEPKDRNIWVGDDDGDGVKTVKFEWGNISNPLKTVLNNDKKLLEFLRGDNDKANGIMFRSRDASIKLGDIVNSTPVVVKARPNLGYNFLPQAATDSYSGYTEYRELMEARSGTIFVGANDGMLHAFDLTNGKETFAYIPHGVTAKLPKLADLEYDEKHQFYVDGPLSLVDVYWGASSGIGECADESGLCWRNVLLGTAGAGGKSVFALDVTNTNVTNTVLWDLSEKNLPELGYVMQPVQTGFTETGDWIGIFGNGAHSTNGKAVFYAIDLKTGALKKEITLDNSGGNGLMGITLLKNAEQVIQEAYATDLKGNLWRIDLSHSEFANWGASYKIFTTENNRPITYAPLATPHPLGGTFLLFGTGKFYDDEDLNDTGMDALYGVWDKNNDTVNLGGLVEREAIAVGIDGQYYQLAGNMAFVDWKSQFGWRLPLNMKPSQRSLYSPRAFGTDVMIDTTLTRIEAATVESCEIEGLSGITVLLDLLNGTLPTARWDTNSDGLINEQDGNYIGKFNPTEGPGHLLQQPGLGLGDPLLPGNPCQPGFTLAVDPRDGSPICTKSTDAFSWVTLQ